MHKDKLKWPKMTKRKSHLVVLVALAGLRVKIILVVWHLEEEGLRGEEEAEGWRTGAAGEEGEDGSKVVGREEDMEGEEAEVGREVGEGWREAGGELQTEDGGEAAWKEEGGVHQEIWAGEEGVEVAWREVWKVEEEAGVDLDVEVPWIEGAGVETGDVVAVSQGVEGEDLTPLYLCSTISRRCPIHQGELKVSRKLLVMMMKTMRRIRLRLGGERKARTVVLEEGVVEGVEVWNRLVQVGAIGVVQEETGEAEEEVEGAQEEEELGEVLEE